MTIVLGCHAVDAVFMAADCRLVRQQGASRVLADYAQKTVQLGEQSILGYAGDVETVALLLGQLFGPQLRKRRLDPASVRRWLPRFLRATYAVLARSYPHRLRECSFLVGSTLAGRPHSVRLIDVLGLDVPDGHNNILAMRTLRELLAGRDSAVVQGSSEGMLYELRAPDFEPRDHSVLGWAAIGSGTPTAARVMARYAGVIFSAEPKLGLGWFMEAMALVMAENHDDGVGGMFLASVLTEGAVEALLAGGSERNASATLVVEDGRFVQVDSQGNRKIPLRYPGEIFEVPPRRPEVFEPYRSEWPLNLSLEGRNIPAFLPPEVHSYFKAQGIFG